MQHFQTSDKKLFYIENLAINHARSLEDKAIKKIDSKDESKQQIPAKPKAGSKDSKASAKKTDDSKENLETVNQDKENSSEVAANQSEDEQKKEETKTTE